MTDPVADPDASWSNGYEALARDFMACRSPTIGAATVRSWARVLPAHAAVLELGCGHGVPISQTLVEAGCELYAVDASPTLLRAFSARFPRAHTQCAPIEQSDFFARSFDAVIAWGVLFLLPAERQRTVIERVSQVLRDGGRFVFTASEVTGTWPDVLTGMLSTSLGAAEYRRLLLGVGLTIDEECDDEGQNHYYFATKR